MDRLYSEEQKTRKALQITKEMTGHMKSTGKQKGQRIVGHSLPTPTLTPYRAVKGAKAITTR
jgi:hypothetical protein